MFFMSIFSPRSVDLSQEVIHELGYHGVAMGKVQCPIGERHLNSLSLPSGEHGDHEAMVCLQVSANQEVTAC